MSIYQEKYEILTAVITDSSESYYTVFISYLSIKLMYSVDAWTTLPRVFCVPVDYTFMFLLFLSLL